MGDEITLATHYSRYVCRLREILIYNHLDPKSYDLTQQEEEQVLYTCFTFEQLSGRKTDRIFFMGIRSVAQGGGGEQMNNTQ